MGTSNAQRQAAWRQRRADELTRLREENAALKERIADLEAGRDDDEGEGSDLIPHLHQCLAIYNPKAFLDWLFPWRKEAMKLEGEEFLAEFYGEIEEAHIEGTGPHHLYRWLQEAGDWNREYTDRAIDLCRRR